MQSNKTLLLLLVAAIAMTTIASSAEAGKNKKKHKRFQNQPSGCRLGFGMKQGDCLSQPASCAVTWVPTCTDPNARSYQGCQKIGSCDRMQCAASCYGVSGDALSGAGCAWDDTTETCYKKCFVATGLYGQITNGQTFKLLGDRDDSIGDATTALAARLGKNLQGDWYFKYENTGTPFYDDSGLVGIFEYGLAPLNLSLEAISTTSFGYGFFSDGNIISTAVGTEYPYGTAYVVGDVIGVHLNATGISFSINGKNYGIAFPGTADPRPLNASIAYVAGVQAHHIGSQWSCFVA